MGSGVRAAWEEYDGPGLCRGQNAGKKEQKKLMKVKKGQNAGAHQLLPRLRSALK